MSDKNKIEWVGINQWYCNNCQTNIDDTIEEMEMHQCENQQGS